MNNRTIIHAMLVLCLLMLATNVLMLKELRTTAAAEDPGPPPANVMNSGCNQLCRDLTSRYTIAEPRFGQMMKENSCFMTCYTRSSEWDGICKGSFTSNKAKNGCSTFGNMLRFKA